MQAENAALRTDARQLAERMHRQVEAATAAAAQLEAEVASRQAVAQVPPALHLLLHLRFMQLSSWQVFVVVMPMPGANIQYSGLLTSSNPTPTGAGGGPGARERRTGHAADRSGHSVRAAAAPRPGDGGTRRAV